MATIIFMNINVTKTEYSYNFDNFIFCFENTEEKCWLFSNTIIERNKNFIYLNYFSKYFFWKWIRLRSKPLVTSGEHFENEDHFVFGSVFSIDFHQCCQARRPKINFEECNQRQNWSNISKIRTKPNLGRPLERIPRFEEPWIQHLLAILLLAHFLSNFIILPDLFHSGNLSMRQL